MLNTFSHPQKKRNENGIKSFSKAFVKGISVSFDFSPFRTLVNKSQM